VVRKSAIVRWGGDRNVTEIVALSWQVYGQVYGRSWIGRGAVSQSVSQRHTVPLRVNGGEKMFQLALLI
jgi:hypothetical protein